MKKISVSVSYDEEKLSTLRLYLEQKGIHHPRLGGQSSEQDDSKST